MCRTIHSVCQSLKPNQSANRSTHKPLKALCGGAGVYTSHLGFQNWMLWGDRIPPDENLIAGGGAVLVLPDDQQKSESFEHKKENRNREEETQEIEILWAPTTFHLLASMPSQCAVAFPPLRVTAPRHPKTMR